MDALSLSSAGHSEAPSDSRLSEGSRPHRRKPCPCNRGPSRRCLACALRLAVRVRLAGPHQPDQQVEGRHEVRPGPGRGVAVQVRLSRRSTGQRRIRVLVEGGCGAKLNIAHGTVKWSKVARLVNFVEVVEGGWPEISPSLPPSLLLLPFSLFLFLSPLSLPPSVPPSLFVSRKPF